MEAIGLLVTLEARRGMEADAEAFLKSAQPLALAGRAQKNYLRFPRRLKKLSPCKHAPQRSKDQLKKKGESHESNSQ